MNIFTPGSPLYVINGESGLINIGNNSGPNVYDFTYVNMQDQIMLNNYEVSQIPILAARYPSNAITFGEGQQNIVENPVFFSSADSTYFIGEATIESVYRFIHYSPYEIFASFPLSSGTLPFHQYIDVYDTTYNSNWQILDSYHYNDSIDVSIDGYGTLQLPGRDLECLRMKREYSEQFKEFFFITKEGVLLVVNDVSASAPDTGYVNADYVVLLSSAFAGVEDEENTLLKFRLVQNYPNPFNPATRIIYDLHHSSYVTLTIYDLSGRAIQTLVREFQTPGNYSVNFNGGHISSGVYFYQLKAGNDFIETRKMILMR
jgi:hypothetical protein